MKEQDKWHKAGWNDALNEAIQIFKKYKDDPMTGRVVILELEELKEGK